MRISDWIKVAERDAKHYRHVVCEFCGAETLTGEGTAFCSNCESVVGSEMKTVQGTNPQLLAALESLREAVGRGDFGAAIAVYDQMLKDRQSPQLLYAKGLMYIEYSNHVVSQIDYGGDGFMEHNAELRHQGALLFSEGKKLITKALSVSEAESREAPSAYGFYRMFLCSMKMNDLRSASEHLKRIGELDKNGVIGPYAKIVLSTRAELYREAGKELDQLVRTKSPPANAFYYAAFVAFKMGDNGGAEHLIKVVGGLVESRKKEHLLSALKEVES